jgi:hypothetical protein
MLRHLADIFEITLDVAFFLLILLVFAGERSGGVSMMRAVAVSQLNYFMVDLLSDNSRR